MQDMEKIEDIERDILPEEIKGRRGLEITQKWGRRVHTKAGTSAENYGSLGASLSNSTLSLTLETIKMG